MIAIFQDKYMVYSFDTNTNSLIPKGLTYYSIIDGIIYENFIFIFLTSNGYYYQILNEANSCPNKLFKASEDILNNHMRISKKIKEKLPFYSKKPFPQKIVSVIKNNLIVADGFNFVTVIKLEHILFKIIHLILERRLDELISTLPILDKKYLKSLLAILNNYYALEEETYRKIFTQELVEHFELYKYLDFFLDDLVKTDKHKAEVFLKQRLITALQNKDEAKIKKLYDISSKNEL
jgi:hypothetical protein